MVREIFGLMLPAEVVAMDEEEVQKEVSCV